MLSKYYCRQRNKILEDIVATTSKKKTYLLSTFCEHTIISFVKYKSILTISMDSYEIKLTISVLIENSKSEYLFVTSFEYNVNEIINEIVQ